MLWSCGVLRVETLEIIWPAGLPTLPSQSQQQQPKLGSHLRRDRLGLAGFNLRHGMVERGERAGHDRDVHDVPKITHISSWVQDEALIENL